MEKETQAKCLKHTPHSGTGHTMSKEIGNLKAPLWLCAYLAPHVFTSSQVMSSCHLALGIAQIENTIITTLPNC